MRMVATVCCALGSTLLGCTYTPGSFGDFQRRFHGERLTLGCLDLAVDRRADLDGAAVLEYTFGNRCKRAVPIDLAQVPVVGRTLDGDEVTLTPYDPRQEIARRMLDARLVGGEALAYPATRPLVQVCADVAQISGPATASRWVCFGEEQRDPAPPAATDAPVADVIAAEGERTQIDEEAP